MIKFFKRATPAHKLGEAIGTAALRGDVGRVKALLEEDPGLVNARGEHGVTPLHQAAANGHARVVVLLLDRGAEINARTEHGTTPLHFAALKGHEDVAELLLAKGAEADTQTPEGDTALQLAVQAGHEGVAELLRRHQDKRLWEQLRSDKPTFLFLRSDRPGSGQLASQAMARIFLRLAEDYRNHVEFIALNGDQYGDLPWKLWKQHVSSIPCLFLIRGGKRLGEYGGDLIEGFARIDLGAEAPPVPDAPLHQAAAKGDVDMVRVLLDQGAEVNAQSQLGATPLHFAAMEGHAEVAELLLSRGAKVDAQIETGATPLHAAAGQGHAEVARLLLAHGADVNAPAKCGLAPLHVAARRGHAEVAEVLLAHGAKAEAQADGGLTPLVMAYQAEVVALLRSHDGRA